MKWAARIPISLVGAALVYVALRVAILVTNFDAVAMPRFELATIGNLASVMSTGTRTAPLANFYDNGGGHLAVGVLAAPLYWLFGDAYCVLKLVPLTLGLVTLFGIWWILARWWSRGAAAWAVWFFALPPPTLLKYSLLAKGNHFENLPLQFAVFALFLVMQTSPRRARWLFVLGFASGCAVFFYFGSLVLLAALCVAELALVGWRRACRDLAWLAPGLALGLAPLVWIEASTRGRVSHFLSAKFGPEVPVPHSFLERLREFFSEVLPRAGAFEAFGPITPSIAGCAFLASFVVVWLAVVARVAVRPQSTPSARFDAWKHAPLVLYLPFFVLVFACSTFDFDVYHAPVEVGRFRYLVPHFAFATVLAGIVVASFWAAGGWKRVVGGAVATALSLTGLTGLAIVDWQFGGLESAAKYPGYCFRFYADVVLERETEHAPSSAGLEWRHERTAWNLSRLRPADEAAAYEGVGHRLAQGEALDGSLLLDDAGLERLLEPIERRRRVEAARGLGSFLRLLVDGGDGPHAALARNVAALASAQHPAARYVVEGLCIDFGYPLAPNAVAAVRHSAELEAWLPRELRDAWLRGQGIACGRLLRRGIQHEVGVALARERDFAPPERPTFWFGVGWGLADGSREIAPPSRLTEWAGGAELHALLVGYGAALIHLYGPERRVELWDTATVDLTEEQRVSVSRGMRWDDYPAPLPQY